jgi:hypothetical protein
LFKIFIAFLSFSKRICLPTCSPSHLATYSHTHLHINGRFVYFQWHCKLILSVAVICVSASKEIIARYFFNFSLWNFNGLYMCTRLLPRIRLQSLCPTVCNYSDILIEPRNLAKAVALETHIKEVLITDLWPKTFLLMTFGFCFIVFGQIPGHHLKPHNCIFYGSFTKILP